MLQNQYYLKFLGLPIYSFSYIENENKLYKLDDQNSLIEASFDELIYIIKSQGFSQTFYTEDLNEKFNPSNYLISPFSKTEEFINNE